MLQISHRTHQLSLKVQHQGLGHVHPCCRVCLPRHKANPDLRTDHAQTKDRDTSTAASSCKPSGLKERVTVARFIHHKGAVVLSAHSSPSDRAPTRTEPITPTSVKVMGCKTMRYLSKSYSNCSTEADGHAPHAQSRPRELKILFFESVRVASNLWKADLFLTLWLNAERRDLTVNDRHVLCGIAKKKKKALDQGASFFLRLLCLLLERWRSSWAGSRSDTFVFVLYVI